MGDPLRYKELRLGQMRAYCAVVRHRSFAAAARALGVSHPVVWQQVRALERDFGLTLVERKGRDLVPTEDGETLFELAGGIVAAMDSVRQAFEDRRAAKTARLVVAGPATLFIQEMAQLVVEFCRQNPRVRLTLRAHQNAEIEVMVADGEADTAVVSRGTPDVAHPRLVSEVVCRRDWCLFTPPGHPLARLKRIGLSELTRHPLVLTDPGNPWRVETDEVFHRAGLTDRLRVALEVGNGVAALRFASLGLGPTLAPDSPRGLDLPGLVRRPLGHLFPPAYHVALWRRGARPRPQARAFIDFARRELGPASDDTGR